MYRSALLSSLWGHKPLSGNQAYPLEKSLEQADSFCLELEAGCDDPNEPIGHGLEEDALKLPVSLQEPLKDTEPDTVLQAKVTHFKCERYLESDSCSATAGQRKLES